MRIIIGADIVPTPSNKDYFIAGDVNKIIGNELIELLRESDFNIFNLEVPLTDRPSPIRKYGPNLIAAKSTVKGLSALNVNLVTLANNHIMDQGASGLADTIAALDSEEIGYMGVGDNLSNCSHSRVVPVKGKRIGIYCCCEREFSIATESKPGANPFDELYSLDHIANLKSKSEYVIVLYHGGRKHYRYPSPLLQKRCRRMVEKGADLVICQHSHCVGSMEEYKGGSIIYGQGNFIFDGKNNEDCWKTGVLLQLEICETTNLQFIPTINNGGFITKASNLEAKKILDEFQQRSSIIVKPENVNKLYQQYAKDCEDILMTGVKIKSASLIYRMINRLCFRKLWKFSINKKAFPEIINNIECESQREAILQAVKNYLEDEYNKVI